MKRIALIVGLLSLQGCVTTSTLRKEKAKASERGQAQSSREWQGIEEVQQERIRLCEAILAEQSQKLEVTGLERDVCKESLNRCEIELNGVLNPK